MQRAKIEAMSIELDEAVANENDKGLQVDELNQKIAKLEADL